MFVVPLIGDSIEVIGGIKYTVLSYAALKDQPAVYVEAEGAKAESILFSAIKKINGTPVKLSTSKVFDADSLIKRKLQLPQQDDKILVGGVLLKVKTLKLREHGKLTNGLLAQCENLETNEIVTVRAVGIERIQRANGDRTFSRSTFVSLYKEYLGVRG